eukprot:Clim_evm18s215 gene=Clim_evmTU18s215
MAKIATYGLFGLPGTFLAILFALWMMPRADVPKHMQNHKLVYDGQLLSEEMGDALVARLKSVDYLPSNNNDLKFYTTRHEHIGEAVPYSPDEGCPHPLMVPSINRTECILPGRVDIAKHYITGGGLEGRKERFEVAASRLQSFGQYNWDLNVYPELPKLFADSKFQQFSKSVCPDDRQYLDPFQFNFIVQVPGQTVALHLDGVYFWGASRFEFPQWLLAVMAFSNLWSEEFIDQVQVVAYLHSWDNYDERAGQFVYWVDGTAVPQRETPKKYAGSAVDGTKTMHAAEVYYPQRKLPIINGMADNRLVNVDGKGEKWALVSGGETLQTYDWDDLRVTVVYRGRCFKDKEEAEAYKNLPDEKKMALEEVLAKLGDDLVKRGRVSQQKLDDMSRFDFAQLLVQEYIKYPYSPTAIIPYNYCALPRLLPFTKPLLDMIC